MRRRRRGGRKKEEKDGQEKKKKIGRKRPGKLEQRGEGDLGSWEERREIERGISMNG